MMDEGADDLGGRVFFQSGGEGLAMGTDCDRLDWE
jgi:hypothetical protein